MSDASEKVCRRCGSSKPLEEFSRAKGGALGRRAQCKECIKLYRLENREAIHAGQARWYEENREKAKAGAAAWRASNPERARELRREHYRANKDRVNAQHREYIKERVHLRWESSYRLRAARQGFEPVVESFTKEELIATYGEECYLCGGPFEQLDHVVEVHQGGHHTLENCRPCCGSCNMRKTHQVRAKKAVAKFEG